jgi:hypothetical protein
MSAVIPTSSDIRIGVIKELLGIWEPYLSRLSLSDVIVDRLIFENSPNKGVFLSPEGLARLFLGDEAETAVKSRLQELLFKAVKLNSRLYRSVKPDAAAKISDPARDQRVRYTKFENVLL